LLVGSFNAINASLYDKLNFNFIRETAPVAGIMRNPLAPCRPWWNDTCGLAHRPGKLIAEQTERWVKVIRAANIKPD
jgi:hypothetical protein